MKMTMPLCGRERLARSSATSDSQCRVSPWNTGFGKRTSSQPRLATVVPSVVSPMETPTMSPSVKALLTMRCPNSVCVRQYSSSRCSGAGLCVSAEKKTLSASVTVRRIACLKVCPTRNSSKYSPAKLLLLCRRSRFETDEFGALGDLLAGRHPKRRQHPRGGRQNRVFDLHRLEHQQWGALADYSAGGGDQLEDPTGHRCAQTPRRPRVNRERGHRIHPVEYVGSPAPE